MTYIELLKVIDSMESDKASALRADFHFNMSCISYCLTMKFDDVKLQNQALKAIETSLDEFLLINEERH